MIRKGSQGVNLFPPSILAANNPIVRDGECPFWPFNAEIHIHIPIPEYPGTVTGGLWAGKLPVPPASVSIWHVIA